MSGLAWTDSGISHGRESLFANGTSDKRRRRDVDIAVLENLHPVEHPVHHAHCVQRVPGQPSLGPPLRAERPQQHTVDLPDGRARLDRSAQHVAGRQLRQTMTLNQTLGLGTLASAGWSQQDNIHWPQSPLVRSALVRIRPDTTPNA